MSVHYFDSQGRRFTRRAVWGEYAMRTNLMNCFQCQRVMTLVETTAYGGRQVIKTWTCAICQQEAVGSWFTSIIQEVP